MPFENYHTHTEFCDGKSSMEEMVIQGLEKKFRVLGFSPHAPLPFETPWTMKSGKMANYLSTLTRLKEKYKNRIQIKTGAETDFIPGLTHPETLKKIYNLDYIIGSVHFITFGEDRLLTVDSTSRDFETILNQGFKGNIKAMAEYYYFLIQQMLRENKIDILGHFDLIKKNNTLNRYFNENEHWYKNIIIKTLKYIQSEGIILEINTGGMARKKIDSPYPSLWILEKIHGMKIPVVLSSDCHEAKTLSYGFEKLGKDLIKIGFKEIKSLDEENHWVDREIKTYFS